MEVIKPPTIGAAIGFITSEPTPDSPGIGTGLARAPMRRGAQTTQKLANAPCSSGSLSRK